MIVVGLPIAIWWFIVRPWRRERRITLDGMLFVSCGLMFFQDPLLNYFNTWSTYNTWMWNRGSWVQDIPGWVSFGEPGAMMAEPLLMNAPGYFFVLLCTMLGCWVMRKIKTALAQHQQPSADRRGDRLDLLLRFRHRGPVPHADRALHVPRRHPGAVDQCRHLLPVADLRRTDVGRRPGRPVLSALLHRRSRPHRSSSADSTMSEADSSNSSSSASWRSSPRVSAFFFVFYNVPAQWFAMHADPWPEDHPEALVLH